MYEKVRAMEQAGPSCRILSDGMEAWVEFEDLMGYPGSKVRSNYFNIFPSADYGAGKIKYAQHDEPAF